MIKSTVLHIRIVTLSLIPGTYTLRMAIISYKLSTLYAERRGEEREREYFFAKKVFVNSQSHDDEPHTHVSQNRFCESSMS